VKGGKLWVTSTHLIDSVGVRLEPVLWRHWCYTVLDGADGVAVGACRHGAETDKKRKRYQLLISTPFHANSTCRPTLCQRKREKQLYCLTIMRVKLCGHHALNAGGNQYRVTLQEGKKNQISYLSISLSLSLYSRRVGQGGQIGTKYTFVRRSNRTELNVGKHLLPHADIVSDVCKHFE